MHTLNLGLLMHFQICFRKFYGHTFPSHYYYLELVRGINVCIRVGGPKARKAEQAGLDPKLFLGQSGLLMHMY